MKESNDENDNHHEPDECIQCGIKLNGAGRFSNKGLGPFCFKCYDQKFLGNKGEKIMDFTEVFVNVLDSACMGMWDIFDDDENEELLDNVIATAGSAQRLGSNEMVEKILSSSSLRAFIKNNALELFNGIDLHDDGTL